MNQEPSSTTLLASGPQIQLNNQGEILSFDLTTSHHVLGRAPAYPPPEGLIVPENWGVMSRCQATVRKVGDDYYIYDGDGEKPSSNQLFVNNTVITPKAGYRLQHNDEIKIGQNPQNWITLTYLDPRANPTILKPKQRSLSLKNRSVLLGRVPEAALKLDAPTVSRRHATIDQDGRGRYILRDYSANGVFVNRRKVVNQTILTPGAVIQIGPYTFVLQGDELVLFDQGDNIRLDAKNLVRVVADKKKQQIRILNDVSLVIEPGQLVALVGGSGSGKSTLMKTLLGIEPVTEGNIYLNGDDLTRNFNIYRTQLGYVPQQDVVHTHLTVREVLYYAAKLRLPFDTDVQPIVEKTLQQIELSERQNTLVKNLSGGQLKRVSIGVELLADPKLFFLDEPTSGLDPGLDKKMMQLLRRLADEGRTVILVTHATTNITLCDRIVFLGLGGNLCYFGPPDQATIFFQISSGDFADIYINLETRDAVAYEAEKFRRSEYKKEYIDNRLSQSQLGKNLNDQLSRRSLWQHGLNLIPRALKRILHQNKNHAENFGEAQKVKGSFWQQLLILIQRYFKLITRDPVYLGLSLLTAPLGIALITLVVPNIVLTLDGIFDLKESEQTLRASLARQVLFVVTCAALWPGFASSLQEIVKESSIYLRERLVNLGLFAYLGSKVLTLSGLAVIQSLLITIVVLIGFKSPEKPVFVLWSVPDALPWFIGVFITTFLTILTASSLGLMVSAGVRNSTQANSALPLLLLPQIIFSGILFDIKGFGKYLTWLMLSRWSVSAYGGLADINAIVPGSLGADSPFRKLPMFNSTLTGITLDWGILLLHTTLYLAMTFWLQKRKDIR